MSEDTRALGVIGATFVELLTCQMALLELLHSQPGFDENAYREAIRKANDQLNRLPSIRTLRESTERPATRRNRARCSRLCFSRSVVPHRRFRLALH
jgi:hypothetical protein